VSSLECDEMPEKMFERAALSYWIENMDCWCKVGAIAGSIRLEGDCS